MPPLRNCTTYFQTIQNQATNNLKSTSHQTSNQPPSQTAKVAQFLVGNDTLWADVDVPRDKTQGITLNPLSTFGVLWAHSARDRLSHLAHYRRPSTPRQESPLAHYQRLTTRPMYPIWRTTDDQAPRRPFPSGVRRPTRSLPPTQSTISSGVPLPSVDRIRQTFP